MQQQLNFTFTYESPEKALDAAVSVLGGHKAVGHRLRPDREPDFAGQWLSDCLNPNRAEKLELSQTLSILRWAHDIGFHGAMNWFTGKAGYSNPVPITTEDEKADLQRRVLAATEQLVLLAKQQGLAA